MATPIAKSRGGTLSGISEGTRTALDRTLCGATRERRRDYGLDARSMRSLPTGTVSDRRMGKRTRESRQRTFRRRVVAGGRETRAGVSLPHLESVTPVQSSRCSQRARCCVQSMPCRNGQLDQCVTPAIVGRALPCLPCLVHGHPFPVSHVLDPHRVGTQLLPLISPPPSMPRFSGGREFLFADFWPRPAPCGRFFRVWVTHDDRVAVSRDAEREFRGDSCHGGIGGMGSSGRIAALNFPHRIPRGAGYSPLWGSQNRAVVLGREAETNPRPRPAGLTQPTGAPAGTAAPRKTKRFEGFLDRAPRARSENARRQAAYDSAAGPALSSRARRRRPGLPAVRWPPPPGSSGRGPAGPAPAPRPEA